MTTDDERRDRLRPEGPLDAGESGHSETDGPTSGGAGTETGAGAEIGSAQTAGHEAAGAQTAGPQTAGPQTADPETVGGAARRVRLGARIAAATTAAAMFLTLGLHGSTEGSASAALSTQPAATTDPRVLDGAARAFGASRTARSLDQARQALPRKPVKPRVLGKRFTRVDLNVRTRPSQDAKVVAVLDFGDKVTITDKKKGAWRQVVYKGETRWVKSAYLTRKKPKPRPKGPSSAPCPAHSGGSGMEGGLTGNAVRVHRAVCAAFPSVTSYGGLRGGGGNHGTGHAVDIMVSGGTGDAIAAYVRAHAGQLGVTEVIWRQRIWTTERASEGWRPMSDRGSITDNHYDHVHVTVR